MAPVALARALAMVRFGAAGATEAELLRTVPQAGPAYESSTLRVANRLWIQKGYRPRADYLKRLQAAGLLVPSFHDFVRAGERARKAIDLWVDRVTDGQVRDLLPSGSLGPSTRMVLTSTASFKGRWKIGFDPTLTAERPFRSPSGRSAANFMTQRARLGYLETPRLQVVELPFGGNRLSMVLFVPRSVTGLAALEGSLDPDYFASCCAQLRSTEVLVHLPRFKLAHALALKDALGALGIPSPFGAEANFARLTDGRGLRLAKVVHEAVVEVDESGTRPNATRSAVDAVYEGRLADAGVREVRADHPFLFVVREAASGSILFIGRVEDPASS